MNRHPPNLGGMGFQGTPFLLTPPPPEGLLNNAKAYYLLSSVSRDGRRQRCRSDGPLMLSKAATWPPPQFSSVVPIEVSADLPTSSAPLHLPWVFLIPPLSPRPFFFSSPPYPPLIPFPLLIILHLPPMPSPNPSSILLACMGD